MCIPSLVQLDIICAVHHLDLDGLVQDALKQTRKTNDLQKWTKLNRPEHLFFAFWKITVHFLFLFVWIFFVV